MNKKTITIITILLFTIILNLQTTNAATLLSSIQCDNNVTDLGNTSRYVTNNGVSYMTDVPTYNTSGTGGIKSCYFGGNTTSYLNLSAGIQTTNQIVTITFWWKGNATSAGRGFNVDDQSATGNHMISNEFSGGKAIFYPSSSVYQYYTPNPYALDNAWHFWVITANLTIVPNGDINMTVDTLNMTQGTSAGGSTNQMPNIDWIGKGEGGSETKGLADNIRIYSGKLNSTELSNLYNYGNETGAGGAGAILPLTTFLNQTPPDLNVTSFMAQQLNLTYSHNITGGLNNSYINWTLTSPTQNCLIWVNQSCILTNNTYQIKYNQTNTTNRSYLFNENDYIPASYRINETAFRTYNTSTLSLTTLNEMIAFREYNMRNDTTYNVEEIGLNTSGTCNIYFANNTESPLATLLSTTSAVLIGTINNGTYSHTHGNNHSDNIFSFTLTNGKVNNVTPFAQNSSNYFIVKPASAGVSCYVQYVPNITINNGDVRTSLNAGTTYTNQTYNVRSHLHQIVNQTILKYDGCGNYTTYGLNCTGTQRTDTIDLNELPPSTPTVTNPSTLDQNVTEFLNITWTQSISPYGASIYYNISLLNADLTYNRTIIQNTTNLNYLYNLFTDNVSLGEYHIKVTAIDNNQLSSFAISDDFNHTKDAKLNLTLTSAVLGTTISSFTINATDNTTNERITNSTNNNLTIIYVLKNHTYAITADAPGYAYAYYNITTNETTYQYRNLTAYTNNSVNIFIYDENTGLPITSNISISITGTSTEIVTTTSGTYYKDNLTDGNYTISFSGTNYTLKSYSVTVANRSTQTLNAYLTTSILTVTFATLDFDSSASLQGATYVQARQINGTWTTIDTRIGDITGRTQFSYQSNVNYRFTVTLTGYTGEQFNLNPVIFDSYTIRLRKITTLNENNTPQGLGVIILYNPTSFYNNGSIQNFTWQISDATGSLVFYNITTTTPTSTQTSTGINTYGETFTHPLNMTSANMSDVVKIFYCYDTTLSSPKCFYYEYLIIGTYASTSFLANKDNSYGLKLFERILIYTLMQISIAGIAFFLGGILIGLPISLFLAGYFYYIGFISLWMLAITILLGIIILFGRQE